jgi:hypothetical protein
MAFNMKPGRSPFMQTGRGIPSAFMQVNPSTGEDLKAQARAKAEAEAKAKLAALGENKGDSKNVRNVEATATVTKEGKKVEKFAKTPAEIAAWKAAPKENKEKYLKQSATETVKLSDVGKDTPKPPETPKEAPKKYGTFWRTGTMTYLGKPSTTTGFSTEGWQGQGDIANMEKKNEYDKAEIEGDLSHNRGLKGSSQNTFEKYDVTEDDQLIMDYAGDTKMFSANQISPYDYRWKDKQGKPGSGAEARAAFMSNALTRAKDWRTKKDQRAAKATEMETMRKQKQSEWENKKKGADAAKAVPVAMQLKKKANSPAQMKMPKMKSKGSAAKMKKC